MTGSYSVEQALAAVASADDREYGVLLENGTMQLGYYKPVGADSQSPHDQDEIYIVQSGSGHFVIGDRRHEFEPGQALFVPAGVEHRFEDFSDDFGVWVIFYGQQGGEAGNE